MKKLLFRSLLLLLPAVILVGGFELKYRHLNNNRYALKRRLLEARLGEIEVLTMGSSHGLHSFQPEILGDKAFNMANPAQTLYYDVQLVLKYVDRMPALKVVVLPVSYFSLESMLDQHVEKWRCYFYQYFFSIPHRDRTMAHDCRNYFLYFLYGRTESLFARTHDYDADVSVWFNQQGGLNLTLGDKHEALQHTKLSMAEAAADRLGKTHPCLRPENIAENVSYLQKLITVLKQRHISVVIVSVPVTPEYRNAMRPEVYRRMQDAISTLCAQNRVEYHNYLADDRFKESDFIDSDHLNAQGIVAFSRIFRDEVLTRVLAQHPSNDK